MAIGAILSAVGAVIAVAAAHSFLNRDPVRHIPHGECIVSPCDGKISEIIDLLEVTGKGGKKFTAEEKKRIAELSKGVSKNGYFIIISKGAADARHIRAPCEGKVVSALIHKKGAASSGRKLLWRSADEILISGDAGKIKVITFCPEVGDYAMKTNKGSALLKGHHIGKAGIKGKIVLAMPDHHLEVKKGGRVYAGETVIAHYGEGGLK